MPAATSRPGSASAAGALLLCALLFAGILPVPALANTASPAGALTRTEASSVALFSTEGGDSASTLSGGGLLAMGGSRQEPGLPPENGGTTGSRDSAGSFLHTDLEGSFFGALIFGQPFEGLGIFDLAALALVGFLLVWRFMPGSREGKNRGDDRFTVGHRDGPSTEVPRTPPDAGRESAGRGRPTDTRGLDGEKNTGRERGGSGLPDRDSAGGSGGVWPERRTTGQDAEPREQRQLQRRPDVKKQAESVWAKVSANASEPAAAARGVVLPENFDLDDFLDGARLLFIRLQEAWAARDTDSLAPFATPDMMRLLREQVAEEPHPVSIKILLLDASLAGLEQQRKQEWADVAFSALMSFGGDAPTEIREVWRFVRERDDDAMWRLSGIQEHEGWQ